MISVILSKNIHINYVPHRKIHLCYYKNISKNILLEQSIIRKSKYYLFFNNNFAIYSILETIWNKTHIHI